MRPVKGGTGPRLASVDSDKAEDPASARGVCVSWHALSPSRRLAGGGNLSI